MNTPHVKPSRILTCFSRWTSGLFRHVARFGSRLGSPLNEELSRESLRAEGKLECMPSKRSAASRRRSTSVPVPAVSGVGGSLVERSRRSRRNFSCAPPRRDVRGCITRPFCDEHWLPIALMLGERPTASRRGLPAAYSVLYHRLGGRWGRGIQPSGQLVVAPIPRRPFSKSIVLPLRSMVSHDRSDAGWIVQRRVGAAYQRPPRCCINENGAPRVEPCRIPGGISFAPHPGAC